MALLRAANVTLLVDVRTIPSSRSCVLHSRVYLLLVGFALWFALAVWGFAGGGLSNYLLVIVSGFIFIVVALQLILSRVGRTERAAQYDDTGPSRRDWAAEDFDTWQGRLSGGQAALQILLPIARGRWA